MIPLLVLPGLIVLVVAFIIGSYNKLVLLRNRFKNTFSQIDVQLERRYDLIPNLVETAKGYMSHERETLEAVIQARNQAATEKIVAPKATFELLPEEEFSWENLDSALDKLAEGSFKVKKWLLGAALVCLMHDREITLDEVELFHAIADTLDCPVPPWVIVAEL